MAVWKAAQYALLRVQTPAVDAQVASLREWCERFVSVGLGGVRDAVVSAAAVDSVQH
jgi:hypothetical protein